MYVTMNSSKIMFFVSSFLICLSVHGNDSSYKKIYLKPGSESR